MKKDFKQKGVRLGAVYIDQAAAQLVKKVGADEKRSMTRQAAYIIENWAKEFVR